jgi:hypothetical protein
MAEKFKLKNNDIRSYGFAGKTCIAGSGCPTPPEAAKQVIDGHPFSLPPLFELNEGEMFKSYRGVIAAMQEVVRTSGKPTIEVFVDGVATPLTVEQIKDWAAEHRKEKGWPEPTTREQHAREMERAMDRPEDPLERQVRLEREASEARLARTVANAMMEAFKRGGGALPTPPSEPGQGRNDELDETVTVPPDGKPQGRARPR